MNNHRIPMTNEHVRQIIIGPSRLVIGHLLKSTD